VPPRFKVCWPLPSSMAWSPMLGSRIPWKNYRPGPIAGLTSCCHFGQLPPN